MFVRRNRRVAAVDWILELDSSVPSKTKGAGDGQGAGDRELGTLWASKVPACSPVAPPPH